MSSQATVDDIKVFNEKFDPACKATIPKFNRRMANEPSYSSSKSTHFEN